MDTGQTGTQSLKFYDTNIYEKFLTNVNRNKLRKLVCNPNYFLQESFWVPRDMYMLLPSKHHLEVNYYIVDSFTKLIC